MGKEAVRHAIRQKMLQKKLKPKKQPAPAQNNNSNAAPPPPPPVAPSPPTPAPTPFYLKTCPLCKGYASFSRDAWNNHLRKCIRDGEERLKKLPFFIQHGREGSDLKEAIKRARQLILN